MKRGVISLALLLGCVPELDVRNSSVEVGRILAVVAVPAEARPGSSVRYSALAVDPDGRVEPAALRWVYCTTPRPLVGNNSASPECLSEPGVPLAVQEGANATGALPLDACARFGPDPPPGVARPRDADGTGGFYQPLRINAFGTPWLHFQRLICNPRSTPADVARDFARDYLPNQNPSIDELELASDGQRVSESVLAGAEVELTLRWPAAAAESYLWIDPGTATLAVRDEELVVSWFATSGSLAVDRSRASTPDAFSVNRWSAPRSAGVAVLWAVLRDDRGGVAFVERALEVR